MELDYSRIGGRIARRRKQLRLTQSRVAEAAEITEQYLSNIERAVSIPSTEVIMRLAFALDTTPDAFLVGAARGGDDRWRAVAERLRPLSARQLDLAERFLDWVAEQDL